MIVFFGLLILAACGGSDEPAAVALTESVAPAVDMHSVEGLRALAEAGDASAQNNLGTIYDNGQGVPEDDAEAVKWYRLAADQGLGEAQLNLGKANQLWSTLKLR